MITRRLCLPPFQTNPRTSQPRQLPEPASRRTIRLNDATLPWVVPGESVAKFWQTLGGISTARQFRRDGGPIPAPESSAPGPTALAVDGDLNTNSDRIAAPEAFGAQYAALPSRTPDWSSTWRLKRSSRCQVMLPRCRKVGPYGSRAGFPSRGEAPAPGQQHVAFPQGTAGRRDGHRTTTDGHRTAQSCRRTYAGLATTSRLRGPQEVVWSRHRSHPGVAALGGLPAVAGQVVVASRRGGTRDAGLPRSLTRA